MLRRKLLIMLAMLTALMLVTALSSVLLMQGVLRDLEHINDTAAVGTTASRALGESVALIESVLREGSPLTQDQVDLVVESAQSISNEIDGLQSYYSTEPGGAELYSGLDTARLHLEGSVDAFVAASGGSSADEHVAVLASTSLMRSEIFAHSDFAFGHMKEEQLWVTARFRAAAIGLAVVFVVLINIAIILLIRAASMVLRPVDQLLDASRHLALEEYDYRVEVGPKDEFAELAAGFNTLAQHLETNEQRKIETLHQVARTLNHELNNAIAIIELQLRMVAKSPSYDPASGRQLELIHQTLRKMNHTVTSLTQVRRVVLTDYIEGVKMLDLKLSTQANAPDPEVSDLNTGAREP